MGKLKTIIITLLISVILTACGNTVNKDLLTEGTEIIQTINTYHLLGERYSSEDSQKMIDFFEKHQVKLPDESSGFKNKNDEFVFRIKNLSVNYISNEDSYNRNLDILINEFGIQVTD